MGEKSNRHLKLAIMKNNNYRNFQEHMMAFMNLEEYQRNIQSTIFQMSSCEML